MALILSRKLYESVLLKTKSGEVIVTLVENDRGKCRLAFTAPKEVDIVRIELLSTAEQVRLKALTGVK